jgi:hypothetical protein
MPARNVVPYYELPRYISSNFTAIASGASSTLRTSTIQLNQIPDKLVMFVRPNAMTNATPDYFLSIDSVSVNFNNQSGILASATKQDLYRYSVENGSNQNWFEFSGKANKFASGASSTIATAGSVLVLEFGKDIQITEDFYSAGSLGNFNLQVNVTATNQTGASVTPEVVIITMNSGVFVNERGTSSTYTGILTKQDVLDASAQEPYGRAEVQRMVGGGFLDTLKSVAGKLLPKLPGLAKGILSQMEHPAAKKGAQVLGALGYAKPADRLAGRLM